MAKNRERNAREIKSGMRTSLLTDPSREITHTITERATVIKVYLHRQVGSSPDHLPPN
jgi:hypothetical protein